MMISRLGWLLLFVGFLHLLSYLDLCHSVLSECEVVLFRKNSLC